MSWTVKWRPSELDFLVARDDGDPLIVVRPRVRLGEEGRLDGATVAAVIAEALTRGLTECASCGLLMARYERVEEDEDRHVDVEHELCEGCREDAQEPPLDTIPALGPPPTEVP